LRRRKFPVSVCLAFWLFGILCCFWAVVVLVGWGGTDFRGRKVEKLKARTARLSNAV